MKKIESAHAIYTGGNIWAFTAKVNKGYLLVNDNEWMILVDKNPYDDFEEACFEEWQTAHEIRELSEEEQKEYFDVLMDYIRDSKDNNVRGGITDKEIDYYKETF